MRPLLNLTNHRPPPAFDTNGEPRESACVGLPDKRSWRLAIAGNPRECPQLQRRTNAPSHSKVTAENVNNAPL